MSHLSSEVKEVYVAYIKNKDGNIVRESTDYDFEHDAISWAKDTVSYYVQGTDEFYYAVIEHQVVPRYI